MTAPTFSDPLQRQFGQALAYPPTPSASPHPSPPPPPYATATLLPFTTSPKLVTTPIFAGPPAPTTPYCVIPYTIVTLAPTVSSPPATGTPGAEAASARNIGIGGA